MRASRIRALRALVGTGALLAGSVVGVGGASAQTSPGGHQPAAVGTGDVTESGAPVLTTPGTESSVITMGPYTIPAAPVSPDGTHAHAHTGNVIRFNVEKPCTNCYITSMTADLKYADGTEANFHTDAQLHHMVLFNSAWGRTDPTCGFSFLGFLGQRFFAAGNEKTPIVLPPNFGYKVGATDSFTLIYELANTKTAPQDVFIEMDYEWVPDTRPGMKPVEPIWLDIDQCGDSEVQVPAGRSTQTYTWTANRAGGLLAIGGHLHDHGVNIATRNDTTGELLCDSVASYGGRPEYIDHHGMAHLSGMSRCFGLAGGAIARIEMNDRITITSTYDAPEPIGDAMGIVMAYLGDAPVTGTK